MKMGDFRELTKDVLDSAEIDFRVGLGGKTARLYSPDGKIVRMESQEVFIVGNKSHVLLEGPAWQPYEPEPPKPKRRY